MSPCQRTRLVPQVSWRCIRTPRFGCGCRPTYSSWINQVERFFAHVTADLLQRSDHRSVQALETDVCAWVKAWNDDPHPFIWTKSAEQILNPLA